MAQSTEQWAKFRQFALPPEPRQGISLPWIVRSCLFVSFCLALLQYEVHSGVAPYLHLAMLFLAGLFVLCGRRRAERVQNLFRGGGLLFPAMLFSEAISYISGDDYSTRYGLVFVGVVLASRLVVQEIGVPNVMRAYSQAGMVTVCFLCFSGRKSLDTSVTRFSGGTAVHPNLLAFVLGGFFYVLVWRALEYKVRWKRWATAILAIVTFVFIYLAGSRGTLSAVLIAALALGLRRVGTRRWLQRFRIRHWHIIFLLVGVPLLLWFLLQHSRLTHIADSVNTSLQLTSQQRGLRSGLSGRTGIWQAAFGVLRNRNRWFTGFGYRAGNRLVGTIDNGYIQLLFESGLISGSMILWGMVRVFVLVWRASKTAENNAWTRYYTMLWCLMIVYFLNNISTRYLFSFGSSFSICVILLMTASRQELIGAAATKPAKLRFPARSRRPGRLDWNRPDWNGAGWSRSER